MGCGIGIKTGRQPDGHWLVLLDADTLELSSAKAILTAVDRRFGEVPLRIGQKPKAGYLLRLSGELQYRRIEFGDRNSKGQLTCRLEVLSDGRQFVAHGTHPKTQAPYTWPRPLPSYEELPIHDPAKIVALLEELRADLPAASEVLIEGAKTEIDPSTLRGDPATVAKAVGLTPNTSATFPSRESYRDYGYAIKASLPDNEPAAFELFLEWTARWTDGVNDPEVVASDWRRMKPPFRRGASWLYKKAEEASPGWSARVEQFYDANVAAQQPATPATAPTATPTPLNGEPVDLFGNADPATLAEPPPGSMPVILEDWAHDIARRMGVPVALPAAAGLAVVGAAIGCSLKIRSRLCDDREEPAALWMIIVAEPGSAKSPVIAAAVRPLRMLDRERYDADKAKHDGWIARAKRLPKGVAPTEPEPKIRRSVVDDVTIEKQIRIHMENPRGILRAPDEFMGLLGSLGAYKKGAQVDRTQILRTFDGGEITVDRVGSGSTRAGSALMGIVAGTQPDIIQTLTRDLGSDGLLQRCIFVTHDGQRRRELDEHPDKAAVDAYGGAIRTLAMMEPGSNSTVALSRSAYEVLMRANDEIAAMRDLPGASKEWAGHISKWGKILPRLVLCFHALDHVDAFGEILPGATIDRTTAEKAVRFARFLLRHSLQFHETYFGERAEASEARNIAGYLLTKPQLSRVNRRNIYDARTNLRGAENARALQAAMRELENANWVEPVEADQHGAKAWAINPAVHQRFEQHAEREREERRRGRELIMRAADARKWLNSGNPSEQEP